MDARETLARALLASEVDVHSEDPWEEAGEELHKAYLAVADAIIEALRREGVALVPSVLLEQALGALRRALGEVG